MTFRIKLFDHTATSEAQWKKTLAACDKYLLDHAGVRVVWDRVKLPRAVPLFKPETGLKQHIDEAWFAKTYTAESKGYDFCIAYFDERDWVKPYPKNELRGQSIEERYGVSEIALTGSHTKKATRPISPGKYDTELTTRLLHEMSHGIFDHKVKKPDTTHAWHYDKKNLLGALKEWGYVGANRPEKIIVHHTAVSRAKAPLQFKATDDYHRQQFNFRSSLGFYGGYHLFIEPKGNVLRYRNDTEEGAHTLKENRRSLAVCLTGNFDVEMPTTAQIGVLRGVLEEWRESYGPLPIFPHRKFAKKSCPGSLLADDWASLLLEDYAAEVEKEDLYAKYWPVLEAARQLLAKLLNR